VYYKFDPDRIEDVRALVGSVFDAIELETGVKGRWLRRRDDPSTFMEVYADVSDAKAFDRALATALEKADFEKLEITRITEIFQCA
jgi:hypothetical protein